MTVYMLIGLLVVLIMATLPEKFGGGLKGMGLLLLGVMWPVLPVAMIYFGLKWLVFNQRGPHSHRGVAELECLFCFASTVVVVGYVCLHGGPVLEFLRARVC
jgi:hypothetical protein